ncbi:hypothetical protein B7494_g5765 [Chlorociboria aeruginascens]|nr:hypothetical protein B7494_g5765 [Chlorociboria aeruginascens]
MSTSNEQLNVEKPLGAISEKETEWSTQHLTATLDSPESGEPVYPDEKLDPIDDPSRRILEKVTCMTQRLLSSSVSFFTAIIQDDHTAPAFSYDQSLALIKSMVDQTKYLDNITIDSLTLNSWLVIGLLHNTSELGISQRGSIQAGAIHNNSETDSESDILIPNTNAIPSIAIISEQDEQPIDEDDLSSGINPDTDADSDLDSNSASSGNENECTGRNRRNRWFESEDERLQEFH